MPYEGDRGWNLEDTKGGMNFLPKIIATLKRGKDEVDISGAIKSLRFVESSEALDSLVLTIVDPYMVLLNTPLLLHDGNTTIKISFGYPTAKNKSAMFPPFSMVLEKVQPSFGDGGVEVELNFFDKGINFTGYVVVDTWTRPSGYTESEIVEELAAKNGYKAVVEKTKTRKEVWTQGNLSDYEFLTQLAGSAIALNPAKTGAYKFYVENDTFYFLPTNYDALVSHTFTFYEGRNGEVISFSPSVSKQEVVGATGNSVVKIGQDYVNGQLMGYYAGGQIVRPNAGGKYWFFIDAARRVYFYDPVTQKPLFTTGEMLNNLNNTSYFQDVVYNYQTPPSNAAVVAALMKMDGSLTPAEVIKELEKVQNANKPVVIQDTVSYNSGTEQTKVDPTAVGAGAVAKASQTAGQEEAVQGYKAAEEKTAEAELVILGNPLVQAKQVVNINNVGTLFSGRWYANEVEHSINESGYITTIKLTRQAINNAGDGATPAEATADNIEYAYNHDTESIEDSISEGDEVLTPEEQKQEKKDKLINDATNLLYWGLTAYGLYKGITTKPVVPAPPVPK